MRNLIILIFILSVSSINAQTESPEQVVRSFFKAMNRRDADTLGVYFAPEVSMVTIYKNNNDSTVVVYEKVEDFLHSIGQEDGYTFEEKVFNFKVSIDGSLAQVWCEYTFILNGNFSHCGVDAFHLVLIDNEWKITHLADTRKREGCKND